MATSRLSRKDWPVISSAAKIRCVGAKRRVSKMMADDRSDVLDKGANDRGEKCYQVCYQVLRERLGYSDSCLDLFVHHNGFNAD